MFKYRSVRFGTQLTFLWPRKAGHTLSHLSLSKLINWVSICQWVCTIYSTHIFSPRSIAEQFVLWQRTVSLIKVDAKLMSYISFKFYILTVFQIIFPPKFAYHLGVNVIVITFTFIEHWLRAPVRHSHVSRLMHF